MAAYADIDFYRDTYKGRACDDDDELERLLERATDDIDLASSYQLTFSALDADDQLLIRKAVCAQAENFVINGDVKEDFASGSLGSFSVSNGNGKGNSSFVCDSAMRFLNQTGYGFRGIGCVQFQDNS